MPKVSVIIPVYNVEKYLRKCLDSVCGQTIKDIEIICVNDCSQDNSLDILKEYALKDERVIIMDRENNGGLSAARNSGMKLAHGEYIYFIDSDDWVDIDYVEKMLTAAEKKNVDIVVNTNIIAEYIDKNEPFLWKAYQRAPKNGEFLSKEKSIGITPCMVPVHLYKKSFLDQYQLFFPEGYIHEDNYFQFVSEVWLNEVFIFHGAGYHYVQHDNSIMSSSKGNVISYLKIVNLVYDYYCQHNLLYKYDIKICNPKVYSKINGEKSYEVLRDTFLKLTKYFKAKQALFDEFDKFIIEAVRNTQSYTEFKTKYNVDLRVSFLKSKLKKVV